jgi:hypothetical protein
MTRIVQIAIGPADRMFCLLEDGTVIKYDAARNEWSDIQMPAGFEKGHVDAIATTRLPTGFELVKNNRTQTWTWRKLGSNAVPPPAIEGEVGEVFDNREDAINDAKQRYLLKATETPP